MPKLEDLNEAGRQAVLDFPCWEYQDAPFVPLSEPFTKVRLALVTSAGVHLRGDRPFTPGDQTFRAIPSRTPAREIIQTHPGAGFNRIPMYRDLNISFPIDRLRELADRGAVGELCDTIGAALAGFEQGQGPVLAEYPQAGDPPARVLRASEIPNANQGDPAAEVTTMAPYYQRWLEGHEGRTQVGVTGISPGRLSELTRFLQSFVRGEPSAHPDKREDVSANHFLRDAADDLKVFLFEARMAQCPEDDDHALQRWFWGETAVARLLVQVVRQLTAQGDEQTAEGIAR